MILRASETLFGYKPWSVPSPLCTPQPSFLVQYTLEAFVPNQDEPQRIMIGLEILDDVLYVFPRSGPAPMQPAFARTVPTFTGFLL